VMDRTMRAERAVEARTNRRLNVKEWTRKNGQNVKIFPCTL